MGVAAEIFSNMLLFMLVFGMSATVDIGHMRAQLSNRKAFLTGLVTQFVVLPFLGFLVVKALRLEPPLGITLLVVTSSPGGSYSNWWCSLFNADLALSVAMTAISTMMSILMLPLNLYIYASAAYDSHSSVMQHIDWIALFVALVIVIFAIGSGLYCSAKENSPRFHRYANIFGNLAGISLILLSTLFATGGGDSTSEDGSSAGSQKVGIVAVWEQSPKFYIGVASPCVLGLIVANVITTYLVKLKQPERVSVSVECCYQNVGIATSVAISMFNGAERAEAMSVPLFYGIVEAVVLGIYCTWAWKKGWTKAPAKERFYRVLLNSYEVEGEGEEDGGKDVVASDMQTQSSEEEYAAAHARRKQQRGGVVQVAVAEEGTEGGFVGNHGTGTSATPAPPEMNLEVPSWIT